jgi:4-amino-4-deoxy-L-arabinose transferase-like glycosyltransferase
MDASRYFTQAKYLEVYGISAFRHAWGGELSAWTDLPLVPFFFGLIFTGLGEARPFIQLFTTMFFSASVVLTYLFARDLWDEETGVLAGLLLLCQPYLLLHVPLMMVDLAAMFFLILTLYTFSRALRSGTVAAIFLAAISMFLLFWVKYSTWILFSVLPLIWLVHSADGHQKARRTALVTCGLALLLIVPLFIGLQDVIMAQIRLLIDFQRPGLARWSESFLSTFFFQTHPLVALAALGGLGVGLLNKDRKILIPAYLIILLVLILRVKRIRYLLPIFPMLAIVAAYGIRRLPSPRLRKFLVLSALGGSLTLALGAFLPFTKQLSIVNIQAAGRFLDTLAADDIAVYAAPQRAKQAKLTINIPLLDLFTNKRVYSLTPSAEENLPAIDQTSSFRFTWEQKLPDFYQPPSGGPSKPAALVVISPGAPHLSPAIRARVAQYRQVKAFAQKTGLFSYTTFATIYYD